jgi:hypothetical protein
VTNPAADLPTAWRDITGRQGPGTLFVSRVAWVPRGRGRRSFAPAAGIDRAAERDRVLRAADALRAAAPDARSVVIAAYWAARFGHTELARALLAPQGATPHGTARVGSDGRATGPDAPAGGDAAATGSASVGGDAPAGGAAAGDAPASSNAAGGGPAAGGSAPAGGPAGGDASASGDAAVGAADTRLDADARDIRVATAILLGEPTAPVGPISAAAAGTAWADVTCPAVFDPGPAPPPVGGDPFRLR